MQLICSREINMHNDQSETDTLTISAVLGEDHQSKELNFHFKTGDLASVILIVITNLVEIRIQKILKRHQQRTTNYTMPTYSGSYVTLNEKKTLELQ